MLIQKLIEYSLLKLELGIDSDFIAVVLFAFVTSVKTSVDCTLTNDLVE